MQDFSRLKKSMLILLRKETFTFLTGSLEVLVLSIIDHFPRLNNLHLTPEVQLV